MANETIKCPHCGKYFGPEPDGKIPVPDRDDSVHYVVNHNADTTETGLPMNRTFVRTLWNGHSAQYHAVDAMLRDWCRERFGPETDYVQGVAPVKSWSIHNSTREEFDAASPIKWGGYPTETKRVVLAIGRKTSLGNQPVMEVVYEVTKDNA